jgi:hypothetical protein
MTYAYACECGKCDGKVLLDERLYRDVAHLGVVVSHSCALAAHRVILQRLGREVVLCQTSDGGRPTRVQA